MRKSVPFVVAVVFVIVIFIALGVLAWQVAEVRRGVDPPALKTPFQMVLLDDGQVYYGKLSRLDSSYPEMTDVYYVERVTDPQTKQAKNVLIKRGKEWHAPQRTFFNARHIIMIEPVNPSSQVAKLISESQHQK